MTETFPLKFTVRHAGNSPRLAEEVEQCTAKLAALQARISRCEVLHYWMSYPPQYSFYVGSGEASAGALLLGRRTAPTPLRCSPPGASPQTWPGVPDLRHADLGARARPPPAALLGADNSRPDLPAPSLARTDLNANVRNGPNAGIRSDVSFRNAAAD